MKIVSVTAYFQDSLISEICNRLSLTTHYLWSLDGYKPPELPPNASVVGEGLVPKAKVLNRLSGLYSSADAVLFVDDDIHLDEDFLPRFLAVVEKHQAVIAAPALTRDSYWSHGVTLQQDCEARETSFIEVGPFVFMRGEFLRKLLPFPEDAEMGWGLDFWWSHLAMQIDAKMLIVDSVPMKHNHRKVGEKYELETAMKEMKVMLERMGVPGGLPRTIRRYD